MESNEKKVLPAGIDSLAGEKKPLLAIVGPTASGKTALSVLLAKRLGGEILSCDSMQIYRGMDIGTAKPTMEEREGIPHHLLDIADADTPFSCADYVKAASQAIDEILARKKLPILCGGTGLYLDALLRGGNFEETETDPAFREELLTFAEQHGNHALHERLAEIDPESAATIHENNVKRVIRALEIHHTSGMTKTEADRRSRVPASPYRSLTVGLQYPDRSLLYQRIDRRVEQMLADGLLEETRSLLSRGVFAKNSTAAQAIGYKELLGYLRGEESPEAAVERLKTATRRYAKRQLTWFGARDYVHWIPMTASDGSLRPAEELLEEIVRLFNELPA